MGKSWIWDFKKMVMLMNTFRALVNNHFRKILTPLL